MYYIVWNYKVSKAGQAKFEEHYGRSGEWFKLFEPCHDYLGHELIKNTNGEGYVLIDKWMSKQTYDGFVSSNQLFYDDLNKRSKELYSEEILIGTFETL